MPDMFKKEMSRGHPKMEAGQTWAWLVKHQSGTANNCTKNRAKDEGNITALVNDVIHKMRIQANDTKKDTSSTSNSKGGPKQSVTAMASYAGIHLPHQHVFTFSNGAAATRIPVDDYSQDAARFVIGRVAELGPRIMAFRGTPAAKPLALSWTIRPD